MIRSKIMKSILLTTSLTLGLSLFTPVNIYAASYTAVGGDTLYKISQLFATSTTNLMRENNLKSTSLNIGQMLNVPCNTYTVQKGDTLFLIAQRYKITLTDLKRANNTYGDNINIGQILNIPALTVSAPTSSTLIGSAVPSSASAVSTTSTPPLDTTYSASDLDLLSRLITAEAQGEPYDVKVAVGAVVMNRVKSDSFPNSISDVIYQNINGYYQFTPVVNGWIDKPADSDSIKAAKAALSGLDTTNKALFYYDNKTTNPWMLAKPVSIKIGNMVFAF